MISLRWQLFAAVLFLFIAVSLMVKGDSILSMLNFGAFIGFGIWAELEEIREKISND